MKLSNEILPFFEKAGWFLNRTISLTESTLNLIPNRHPALEILQEFGGLEVGEIGDGINISRSDIIFDIIDSDNEEIEIWNDLLKTKLIGIAHVEQYHCELFVDFKWKFYLLILNDTLCFVGENFEEAMQNLLFGRRSRPMFLPNQSEVWLSGQKFTKDSPETYHY